VEATEERREHHGRPTPPGGIPGQQVIPLVIPPGSTERDRISPSGRGAPAVSHAGPSRLGRRRRRGPGAAESKRERACQAYAALVAAGQPVTGARLAEAAVVSPSFGRALLAEFQADPTLTAQANG
jgi:hypothetical protein